MNRSDPRLQAQAALRLVLIWAAMPVICTLGPAPAALAGGETGKVAVELSRTALIRLIRSELWRVGCLDGDGDRGGWSAADRAAAKAFADASGLAVRTRGPSPELLSALAGERGEVCAAGGATGDSCFSYNDMRYCD